MVVSGIFLGLGVASRFGLRHLRTEDVSGHVVLITGGSRGLGLGLAREFARRGCRIVICGRDEDALTRARDELRDSGADILAIPCDVSDGRQIDRLVAETTERFGPIDILVANAGQIGVGPFATTTEADFENALDVMFWGVLRPIRAVLPAMRTRGRGRIVTITSIGGKVSVPHLMPYSAAKFAAVGLSEGLRAELAGTGIRVTTVVPGLMRTGSHLNVEFRGNPDAEYAWFSLGASLPVVSMDAARAAAQIVAATVRGDTEVILSLPAAVLARVHGLAPGLTTDILALVNRLLPSAPADGGSRARGYEIESRRHASLLDAATTLGREAASRFNQTPPPIPTEGKRP